MGKINLRPTGGRGYSDRVGGLRRRVVARFITLDQGVECIKPDRPIQEIEADAERHRGLVEGRHRRQRTEDLPDGAAPRRPATRIHQDPAAAGDPEHRRRSPVRQGDVESRAIAVRDESGDIEADLEPGGDDLQVSDSPQTMLGWLLLRTACRLQARTTTGDQQDQQDCGSRVPHTLSDQKSSRSCARAAGWRRLPPRRWPDGRSCGPFRPVRWRRRRLRDARG